MQPCVYEGAPFEATTPPRLRKKIKNKQKNNNDNDNNNKWFNMFHC